MNTNKQKISVKELTDTIAMLMKQEIVALCRQENEGLTIHFPGGQEFLLTIQEK